MAAHAKDKWFWLGAWPLSAAGLVGYGMLGPGSHPWTGWSNAIAGGACVLMALGMGTLLGLRIRQSVSDNLAKWAVDAQAMCDQEALDHEKTEAVLFELAHGLISSRAAQRYLTDLDKHQETDDEEEH